MPKVVGFTALHYGRDYLSYAIRSIIDHIDEYHVAYSAIGSHGHRTAIPCPETRAELYAIAQQAAGSKLRWHDGEWAHEGLQRDSIHEYAPDADVIIVLDADEIWHSEAIPGFLRYFEWANKEGIAFQRYRHPIIHYWRSFYRCVLHDPAYPERIIIPNAGIRETVVTGEGWAINHMGYAQRPEIVRYKIETHGHKNEWRKDVDWFQDRFMNVRATTDLHPVGSEYWNVEEINPWDYLPDFMKQHPYAHLAVIE